MKFRNTVIYLRTLYTIIQIEFCACRVLPIALGVYRYTVYKAYVLFTYIHVSTR